MIGGGHMTEPCESMEEYLAKLAAAPAPDAPAAPAPGPWDGVNDAAGLQVAQLLADSRRAIADCKTPAAVLSPIIQSMFGTGSQEAQTVAELIREAEQPGGPELALALIARQRKFIKKEMKELERQLASYTALLLNLDSKEAYIKNNMAQNSDDESALTAVLCFVRCIDEIDNIDEVFKSAQELFEKHHRNASAMGLLLGALTEAEQKQFDNEDYSSIEMINYAELREKVMEAALGRAETGQKQGISS